MLSTILAMCTRGKNQRVGKIKEDFLQKKENAMKFWSNADTPSENTQVPERRLLAAVLQRAITDYLTGDGDLRDTAEAWLIHDQPEDAPLTFKFICEALDLDYPSLKEAIRSQGSSSQGTGNTASNTMAQAAN